MTYQSNAPIFLSFYTMATIGILPMASVGSTRESLFSKMEALELSGTALVGSGLHCWSQMFKKMNSAGKDARQG